MSSTEQKNVTQPFISSCFTYGILPTIITGCFDDFGIDTDNPPFVALGPTPNLGERLRSDPEPLDLVRRLLPSLDSAPVVSRASPYILRLCSDARCYFGNMAVLRLSNAIIRRDWGLHFTESAALRHARRHVGPISSLLAPAAYGVSTRTESNVAKFTACHDAHYYRNASDCFDKLSRSFHHDNYERSVRGWCSRNRSVTGFQAKYYSEHKAVKHYHSFENSGIHACDEPPELKHNWFRQDRSANHTIKVYRYGDTYYIKVYKKYPRHNECTLYNGSSGTQRSKTRRSTRGRLEPEHELYVLAQRDLKDISYLLHSFSAIHHYFRRRGWDLRRKKRDGSLIRAQKMLWQLYSDVIAYCGSHFESRNKLGVYFDVLQWRYLAWKSGDIFYNHSYIMQQKIESKDLQWLPNQEMMLNILQSLPTDWAVDLLGIYKASIYPEVDPFKVVTDQYKLHYSRHDTQWEPNSSEAARFEDTRSYMWYLGIRVLYKRLGMWPGKIREGVERRPWHNRYKSDGIPGDNWREAHDVDLTNSMVVADITDEQYFKQADSACAPPMHSEYLDFKEMRKCPRRHKRKLLYAIQEPELPSLPLSLLQLNRIGAELPDGYVGKVDVEFDFSTDIVTGSRCERHKDAPRPFYAASPPWGCILSYFDGLTRDFLNNVPQSMLGKSTRQKFIDLRSTSEKDFMEPHTFYVSDDKAKYSPRMDPNSQQLPAEFFAELFGIPGMRAFGPVMYHCDLYYRVHGHLVHYNSNGTDREGMRGASNTWLEIVAQGLSTRLCREKGLIKGKSMFLSFIDDGLRKFTVESKNRTDGQCLEAARHVIDDVIFGLRVLGRELSWDKTFISKDMFVMLNELVVDDSFISSGLKSYCTLGDLDMKEVMSAADYEQLYFGKLRGAHGVGAPIDLCHYSYLYEVCAAHYRMGVRLQDNHLLYPIDYRLYCVTPMCFGGGGLRSLSQMACNEVANVAKEGIGTLTRLAYEYPLLSHTISVLMEQELEEVSPVDFMREPEQFHVTGPRIKTQRQVAMMRTRLRGLAQNEMSRRYLEQDEAGLDFLATMGRVYQSTPAAGAEEVRLIYASSPVVFIDDFIQKLASSTTLAEFLDKYDLSRLRKLVRKDLIDSLHYYPKRSFTHEMLQYASNSVDLLSSLGILNS